ncbi:MAG TPA: hypothetical protein VFG39_05375 [Balneolaceae bacterium]|nr:hypothetical protein [Balneolaceae bacterium]
MNALSTTGRVLFALPFGVFGINHFLNATAIAGYVPAFFPGGAFWVYLVGVIFIAVCICIIAEKKVRLAALILGIVLLIFVLTIHLPGLFNESQASLTPFLKDLALAGASFYIAGHYPGNEMEVE